MARLRLPTQPGTESTGLLIDAPHTSPLRDMRDTIEDGWTVLLDVITVFKGLNAELDFIDAMIEEEEFAGLWWW